MFDITNRASFDHLPNWLQEVQKHCRSRAQFVLVAHKCDLQHQRVVPSAEAQRYADEHLMKMFETCEHHHLKCEVGDGDGDGDGDGPHVQGIDEMFSWSIDSADVISQERSPSPRRRRLRFDHLHSHHHHHHLISSPRELGGYSSVDSKQEKTDKRGCVRLGKELSKCYG